MAQHRLPWLGGHSGGAVRTHDPLYGAIDIPDWLLPVLLSTEVQRLREVRLANTSSPLFGGLSDTRRFTHSVGVLHLGMVAINALRHVLSNDECRALLVACLVHDVGTPAFGHLFEYLLKSRSGWTHEGMLRTIINGDFVRSPLYAQLYYDAPRQLNDALAEAGVKSELVIDMVEGRGIGGQLIAGQLDLDNLDNVYRMAFMLGLGANPVEAEQVAGALTVTGDRISFSPAVVPQIFSWAQARRRSYEVIALDSSSLAGQAMLTDCLEAALQQGLLSEADWHLTDEQLLRFFASTQRSVDNETRALIRRFAVADYYQPILVDQYNGIDGSIDLRAPDQRENLRKELEAALNMPCSPYVLYDRGSFSKELTIDAGDQRVEISQRSTSTIVGVFTPQRKIPHAQGRRRAAREVLARLGLTPDCLVVREQHPDRDCQLAFDF